MNDTINRQDAINLVKHRMKHNPMKSVEFIQGLQDAYLRVLSDLHRLPSAERKGKWINHRADDGHHIADCSICGNTLQWFDDEGGHLFCPNCGAKMEGEEE